MKRLTYKRLPFRVRIEILKWVNMHCRDIKCLRRTMDYYGYFEKDQMRKIFQIFYCVDFYPFSRSKHSPLNLMYFWIHELDYEDYDYNYFDIETETDSDEIRKIIKEITDIKKRHQIQFKLHQKFITCLKSVYNLKLILHTMDILEDFTWKNTVRHIDIISKIAVFDLRQLNGCQNLRSMCIENRRKNSTPSKVMGFLIPLSR